MMAISFFACSITSLLLSASPQSIKLELNQTGAARPTQTDPDPDQRLSQLHQERSPCMQKRARYAVNARVTVKCPSRCQKCPLYLEFSIRGKMTGAV